MLKHIRSLTIALAVSSLPVVASIGVSAASPTVTHHRTLSHKVLAPDVCAKLNQHAGCYVESTETDTEAASSFFVTTASAWDGCSGIHSYTQSYYSWTGWRLAYSNMQFAFCYNWSNGVQVTWGPHCVVGTIIGYGGGVDYCSGNGYPNYPGWVQDSWYIFPYSAPWYHVNNLQQVLIYPTWESWSGCTAC